MQENQEANQNFHRIDHDFTSMVKPVTVEELRSQFPQIDFLKNYWANDKTFDTVEPVFLYLYERVRDLPLAPDGIMSSRHSLFESCLWMGFEAMQISYMGLSFIGTPLREKESLLSHLKLMSFLSGLFAPYVQASTKLTLVTDTGDLYDFKIRLEDWIVDSVCEDAGFVQSHIPKYGLFEAFRNNASKDLFDLIEKPLSDQSLVAAFKCLLSSDFGELYLADKSLFRLLAAAENKVTRREAKRREITSVTELCQRSYYLLSYAICEFLEKLSSERIIANQGLFAHKGTILFSGYEVFQDIADIMNLVIDENLWTPGDVRKAGLKGGLFTEDPDKEDRRYLSTYGIKDTDGFVKLSDPLRYTTVASSIGKKIRHEDKFLPEGEIVDQEESFDATS